MAHLVKMCAVQAWWPECDQLCNCLLIPTWILWSCITLPHYMCVHTHSNDNNSILRYLLIHDAIWNNLKKSERESGLVVHTFNAITQEAKAGGSLNRAKLVYIVRPCLRKTKKERKLQEPLTITTLFMWSVQFRKCTRAEYRLAVVSGSV